MWVTSQMSEACVASPRLESCLERAVLGGPHGPDVLGGPRWAPSLIQSTLGARDCFKASSPPKVTPSHHFLLLAAAQTFHLDLMYCVKTRVCRPFIRSPVSWESGVSLRNHQKGSHMFSSTNGIKSPTLTPSERVWLVPSLRPAGVFFSDPWYNQIHIGWHRCVTHRETGPCDLHNLMLCCYIRRGANQPARKMGLNRSEGDSGTPSCPEYPACWVSTFTEFWGKTLLRKCCNPYFFQMWGWSGSNICHQIHICDALRHFLFTSQIFPIGWLVPHGPTSCLTLSIWYVSQSL